VIFVMWWREGASEREVGKLHRDEACTYTNTALGSTWCCKQRKSVM
jgi:hypothetical protein